VGCKEEVGPEAARAVREGKDVGGGAAVLFCFAISWSQKKLWSASLRIKMITLGAGRYDML
jgi:hypothetical protein